MKANEISLPAMPINLRDDEVPPEYAGAYEIWTRNAVATDASGAKIVLRPGDIVKLDAVSGYRAMRSGAARRVAEPTALAPVTLSVGAPSPGPEVVLRRPLRQRKAKRPSEPPTSPAAA